MNISRGAGVIQASYPRADTSAVSLSFSTSEDSPDEHILAVMITPEGDSVVPMASFDVMSYLNYDAETPIYLTVNTPYCFEYEPLQVTHAWQEEVLDDYDQS